MGLRAKEELTEAIRRDRRAVLIVNAHSRRGRKLYRRAYDLLSDRFDLVRATAVQHPAALPDVIGEALALQPDLLVVGGGDGTLSTAGKLLAHQDVALGVLPLGTTNNFARSLGLPLRLDLAIRTLTDGKVADIDLGMAADRLFVNLTSFGVSVQVAHRVRPRLKRMLGRAAYPLTALTILPEHRAFQARIKTDGTVLEFSTHQLNIANGRFHGGRQIARDISIDDSNLVAYRLGEATRMQLMWKVLVHSLTGHRLERSGKQFLTTNELMLETDPPMQADIDGEVQGRTPLHIRCLPNALRVMVPPAFVDR